MNEERNIQIYLQFKVRVNLPQSPDQSVISFTNDFVEIYQREVTKLRMIFIHKQTQNIFLDISWLMYHAQLK